MYTIKKYRNSILSKSGKADARPFFAPILHPKIQRKVSNPGEDEESIQTKSEHGSTPAPANTQHHLDATKGGGAPLPFGTRIQMENAFGSDFSDVRVHTGKEAVQLSEDLNAQAFTHGSDVYFNSGKYNPDSGTGKGLLAHELTHVVQQQGKGQNLLQRTETRRLRGLTVVLGNLRFTPQAKEDVLRHGALLPGADQAHIGFYGDRLGYDPDYPNPTDPYRWGKLKDIIDSDQRILVQKSNSIQSLLISASRRLVVNDILRSGGLTLPTESLQRRIYPGQTSLTASTSADTHHIFYTTILGSPADSALAHELFGHMWLAIRGVPFVHPGTPAETLTRGTLTAAHGVRDPFGNIYTGTVRDFIDRYIGSESGVLASPTQNVGLSFLTQALSQFKSNFASGATGTLNGDWSVPANAHLQWAIICNNYELASSSTPQPAATERGPSAAVTPSLSSAVTRAGIEQDLTTWYGTLRPEMQYVFLQFLSNVTDSIRRGLELMGRLSRSLSQPLSQPFSQPLPRPLPRPSHVAP